MNFRGLMAGAALAALGVVAAGPAGAVVIGNGTVSVGINEYGQLYDAAAGVGFKRDSDGVDVMAAFAPRDSWGVNGSYADDGNYGLTPDVATAVGPAPTADSAVINTTVDGFAVSQSFSFVADNILAIDIELTNVSGGDLASVLFQRLAEFHADQSGNGDEYETNPYSTGVETTFWGFDSPLTSDVWFNCCQADAFDGGAGLRLNLGAMAAGATRSFTFYYGLGDSGLAEQLKAAGATDVMLVANGDGSLAGGMGVALAVPEPATWAMMILGFFGLGAMVRRRKAALA